MFDSIKAKLAQFSFKTMAKKAAVTGAQALAAYAVSQLPTVTQQAAAVGVSVNLDPEQVRNAVVLVVGFALEAGRNLVKRLGPAWVSDWL